MSQPKVVGGSRSKAEQGARAMPVRADELAVPIGPRVLELLEVAYRARRPVLLEGPTGIGKSQIAADLAKRLGLAYRVLDLSLLEPPDLIGLPIIEKGRTHYASPAELPSSGRGILMLEELNRAELPVMQPALQLLSARRLHSYELPPGWSCIAAVNPEDGEYQVNRLDPALRSRFLQLSVCADRAAWLEWAGKANIHPAVLSVVRDHADAFEMSSPRSWAYASDMLHVLQTRELEDATLVRVALRGYLPTAWASVVVEALRAQPAVVMPELDLLFGAQGPSELGQLVKRLDKAKRSDAVAMVAAKLRNAFDSEELVTRISEGKVTLAALEALVAPLPGDLREQCLETAVRSSAATLLLGTTGFEPDALIANYASSPLRQQMRAWRETMVVYRIQLVVSCVLTWLRNVRDDSDAVREVTPQLRLIAEDAGPMGEDILRWLRLRGLVQEVTPRG